jgi:hypothetical protein
MKLNFQLLKVSHSSLWFAVFTWILLLVRFGYRFGSDDQIELLPYALFLHDSSLYFKDLFIHGLHESVPNERSFAAYMLLPFINHLEAACLFLHLISTVILITGMENLAARFVKRRWIVRLCILASLFPFANVTLGNVVTYSEMFQASFLSAAIALWGVINFLDRRYIVSSIILSTATFIHLLEGLNVMIVLSCLILCETIFLKREKPKLFFAFILIYLSTAGVYLLMNWLGKQSVLDGLPSSEYYNILFRFRLPHHYMLTSFPLLKTCVFFFMSLLAIFFFHLKSSKLFAFAAICLGGMFVYAFIAEEYNNVFLASFQFFKLAQWLKFLGLIAAFSLVEDYCSTKWSLPMGLAYSKSNLALLVTVFVSFGFFFHSRLSRNNVYQLGPLKNEYPVIQICNAIKSSLPQNVLFIQPLLCSEIKFYSQRSSFVDFKAAPRNRKGIKEWYRRLTEVYGVDAHGRKKGFEVLTDADSFFFHLPSRSLLRLKEEGVTHILTRKEFPPSTGLLILQNSAYAVYQL